MLFLSHAAEDREVAGEVQRRLTASGVQVYRWREDQPAPPIDRIEELISRADGYLALLSPDFVSDPLCHRERDLAISREKGLQLSFPAAAFIHALMVGKVDEHLDGLPPLSEWEDFTDPASRDNTIEHLVGRLNARGAWPANRSPGTVLFRNRAEELEVTVRGLKNFGGPHFWLVIAPPQLGKTWFLDRLAAMLLLDGREPWVVKLVDIRDQKVSARTDLGSLLKRLFGPDCPTTPEPGTYLRIATQIMDSGQPHLCLIDSAELLAEDTARELRLCLSEIHNRVSEAGQSEARLAVVVASQREDIWRGITPGLRGPRPSILRLSEFSVEVVDDALVDLARSMNHWFDRSSFLLNATRVHRLSEGLPALIARCIAWIRHQRWIGMERLETQSLFEDLAHPYIKNVLLASESLFPPRHGNPEAHHPGASAPAQALEHTLRVLAPYRLFTQSHLLHYLDHDPGLSGVMTDLGWTTLDLWRVISESALLQRPLDEPWQQIPAAIRRLLYRYHYITAAERAFAHQEARSFMAAWADQQQGTEQVVGLVECLWHEAAALRLQQPSALEADIVAYARELSSGLRRSPAYTEYELRTYATQRISRDDEFRDVIGDENTISQIVAAIMTPTEVEYE